jgi:CRISPR-associated protein Cas2
MTRQRPYLIAYDIRRPKRLRRVHRVAKRYGVPLQYSVFLARLTESRLESLIRELGSEIDVRFDDIRIYPIPAPVEVVILSSQFIPDGIFLDDEHVQPFLRRALAPDPSRKSG